MAFPNNNSNAFATLHSRLFSWVVLVVLLMSTTRIGQTAAANENSQREKDPVVEKLLQACTEGDVPALQTLFQDHTKNVIHRRSAMGETCLHVAGIHGQAALTTYVLENTDADPNVRSTFDQGLRMHPLSWNAYGGHVETAKALLDNGAKVNLDVDDMSNPDKKTTVLDIVESILEGFSGAQGGENSNAENPDVKKYHEMRKLLLSFGAHRYQDLEK